MASSVKFRMVLVLFLSLVSMLGYAQAGNSDAGYQAQRRQAMELFNQHKSLEALPLFEDLAKRKPEDDQVLVGLATCLLRHAATLEDEEAAVKERVRAREILLKAKELGNNDTLLQNLLQLLPPDGHISDSKTPVDQAMNRAEAAFARNDFEEAIKNYSQALQLDPKNYSAALFIGDSYFGAKNWAKAAEWDERAIQINPDTETAYRYYADMLTKNGDMEKARIRAIQAVVAEPYNPISWRGLEQWARSNHLHLNEVHLNIPAQANISSKDKKTIDITLEPNLPQNETAVWLAYSLSRGKWRRDEFQKHFPKEKEYRHSLDEETEALTLAARVCSNLPDAKDKKEDSSSRPKGPDLLLLLHLYRSHMIEPYVLLNAADEGIAQDYEGYRQKNRSTLETYLSDFVVPAAPKQ